MSSIIYHRIRNPYSFYGSIERKFLSIIFFLSLLSFSAIPAYTQNNNCTPPTAAIEASSCEGGTISLKLKDASGHAPFDLVVNGITFNNVQVGQSFAKITDEHSIWGNGGLPENANANDGQSIEVGVKFRSAVDGYITGVRFYKGTQNINVHVGSLWSASGTRLASATFTNESASGWQEVRFPSPVAIAANTTYIASYLSPNGIYAYSGSYFTNSDIINNELKALQSTSVSQNGIYKYGSGFPDQSFNGSNYWVDVLFTSSPFSQKTTKFTLTNIVDSNNCSSTGPKLSETSVTVNPLPSGTIKVSGQTCDSNKINLVFDAASGTGPFSLVINGTPYTNITSGSVFNTGVETTSAINIWANNTLPAGGVVSSDGSSIELGVKFRSGVSGEVLGIRFFKDSVNLGTHTGSLWAADGTLLATGIFTNETSSGWQLLIFSTPVAIRANTVYIASYYAPQGKYIFHPNFFTLSLSNSFLTAVGSDANESNGVFKYSSGGQFPTESFNNTNYWVDVVFKPDSVFKPEKNLFYLTNISDANNCTLTGNPVFELVAPFSCTPSFMDSLAPLNCSPQSLKVILSKPISCSSIAPDGSDFTINGPYAVKVQKAYGYCVNNKYSSSVTIQLDKPLQKSGRFQLHIQKGSDGNTLVDEHNQQTPYDSTLFFDVKDTVNAQFTYGIKYGCTIDTVLFSHGGNGADQWFWNLDDNLNSSDQYPMVTYSVLGTKKIKLVTSNGSCSDTATAEFTLNNSLTVGFNSKSKECSTDPVEFTSTAVGEIIKHRWSFGDGSFSDEVSPLHTYPTSIQGSIAYQVNYSVTDRFGCTRSTTKPLDILNNCTVSVPNAFTPNRDGKNDLFKPLNASQADQFEFRVLNRWGQQLFFTTNNSLGWNGSYEGQDQSAGTYIWMLRYKDRSGKGTIERKGTFILLR